MPCDMSRNCCTSFRGKSTQKLFQTKTFKIFVMKSICSDRKRRIDLKKLSNFELFKANFSGNLIFCVVIFYWTIFQLREKNCHQYQHKNCNRFPPDLLLCCSRGKRVANVVLAHRAIWGVTSRWKKLYPLCRNNLHQCRLEFNDCDSIFAIKIASQAFPIAKHANRNQNLGQKLFLLARGIIKLFFVLFQLQQHTSQQSISLRT